MKAYASRRPFWRRLLSFIFWTVIIVGIGLGGLALYAFRDRHPQYSVRINLDGKQSRVDPRPLQVGFGRVQITPDLSDTNRPVWLAGFNHKRAATAVHDDLWAIAVVVDDGYTRFALVALDAIGFFHDDVVTVRERLGAHLKIDYAAICSTHNHSTPDLMGLWGRHFLLSGVHPDYRERVISSAARAIADAAGALEPARVVSFEIPVDPAGLLTDTRRPEVYDPDLRVMHFVHAVDGSTLGTIVGWADHPETPWSRNTEITADFPGYLRDALEHGISHQGHLLAPGVGGTHLYVNGAIGGLMTTSPSVTVQDPVTRQDFKEPSHDKARALGRQLAARILPLLTRRDLTATDQAAISIRARTIEVPVENKLFLLAPVLGIIDRGHPGLQNWNKLRTEIALITVGDTSLACLPGEMYPELVNGGIERPPGGDFNIEPIEVPPLRQLMPGKTKFILGLANDEIGYIIPKSEWDVEPPYLYQSQKSVYGEINSVGPDAASVIHTAFKELCPKGE